MLRRSLSGEHRCDQHMVTSILIASDSRRESADIFSLPTELHIQIFLALQCEDLCNFRAVSTKSRDLLSEGEIVRQWIIHHADKQQLKLYSPPAEPTFEYLLEQQARHRTASELATVLAAYIEKEILRYTLRRFDVFPNRTRHEVFHAVKTQLRDKMVPLILMVQHYLEHCATILLDTVAESSEAFHSTYLPQESLLIEGYEPEQLHLAHKFWMFLTWLSRQILHNPSYAGTVERTARKWNMEPLNGFEYRLFLVFGNMDALVRLIRAPSPKARRKVVDTSLARLDPEGSVLWQQHWQGVAGERGKQVTKEQVKRALDVQLSASDLWSESAQTILVEKDQITPPASDRVPIGTPWQVMDFLCDLAGYDVLHLQPSIY